MTDSAPADDDLTVLEDQIDELLALCRRLHEENQSLKTTQQQLVNDRAGLVAKNEQARSRVEAMITRLKALEQST